MVPTRRHEGDRRAYLKVARVRIAQAWGDLRHHLLWVVTTALLIGFVTATASFKIPPPLQEKQVCEESVAKRKSNPSDCDRTETVLNRSLRDPVAFYTFWLTLFTGGLTLIGVWQWDAIRRQLNQADREFTASHPPHIIVRRVSLEEGTPFYESHLVRPWQVQYVIANTGRGKAHVFEGNVSIIATQDPLPAIPPFDDAGNFTFPFSLVAGQSSPHWLDLSRVQTDPFEAAAMTERGGLSNRKTIYFFGYIQYRDDIGIVRRTAFCRSFDAKTKRFRLVGDADYEYK
jgi:hypothetical protein